MYLTHDSAGGRKEHLRGWKHRDNVIAYFKPKLRNFMQSGEGNTWQGWQNSQKGGQGPPPLPVGWEQHVTSLSKHESMRPYYVHTASGLSTWVHPRLLKPEELPENDGKPGKSWEEPKPVETKPTTTTAAATTMPQHQNHQNHQSISRSMPRSMPGAMPRTMPMQQQQMRFVQPSQGPPPSLMLQHPPPIQQMYTTTHMQQLPPQRLPQFPTQMNNQ
jgi:hypothetical protein